MTKFLVIPGQRGVVAFNIDRIDNIQNAYDQNGQLILGHCSIQCGHMSTLVKGGVVELAELLNAPNEKANGSMALKKE